MVRVFISILFLACVRTKLLDNSCKTLTKMLDFFGMYLLFRYKAIGLLKKFGERCQKSSFTANKEL